MHKQIHCRNHKAALNEKPTTLRIDSSCVFKQFRRQRQIFLFTIKIIDIFELHASEPLNIKL